MGTLIVKSGFGWECIALNKVPSAKLILLAVVAKNEPPISKAAFSPKTIPLGLIKNKFAVPLARSIPLILEIDLPVMRVIIF